MGGNSVKGIWLMEQLYPLEDGSSMFDRDPKLRQELEKEIRKGNIKVPPPDQAQDVDDDQDAKIDKCVKEVWEFYDKKHVGVIDKKQAEQFFKDALELFALRRGAKPKDLLAPGMSMSKAIEQAIRSMDRNGTGKISYKEFEDFVNASDLEEALALITGQTGPRDVAAVVDPSKMVNIAEIQAANPKRVVPGKIEYRNYEQTLDE